MQLEGEKCQNQLIRKKSFKKVTFQVDLDAAIIQLQQMIQQIDRASMDAFQDQLPRGVITEQRVHQQILHACQSLYDRSEMSMSQ